MSTFMAVALAGGAGRRLREFTRRTTGSDRPKQFCAFGGKSTLLQQTLDRAGMLVPPGDTLVVVGPGQERLALEQLASYPGATILPQPLCRGTGAAVLLALCAALARDPEGILLITPSDHGVRDPHEFTRGVATARRAIFEKAAGVVLLGIEADEPRTDYGWITPGEDLGRGIRRVDAFVEKPPRAQARALHAAGAYFHTMVLVARAAELLEIFRRARPGLVALFEEMNRLPLPQRLAHRRWVYRIIEPIDFSHSILGPAGGLAVCRWSRSLGWCDLGTPERMAAWLEALGRPLPAGA